MNSFKNPFLFLVVGIVGLGLTLSCAAASEAADADTPPSTAAAPESTGGTPSETAKEEAKEEVHLVEDATADEQSSYTINTLIMFIAAVLVLFMQAGFAMLEVGMNAAKNTVNILFKNVMDLSVGVLLFLVIGFGLMYPSENLIESKSVVNGEEVTYGFLGKPSSFVERDVKTTKVNGEEKAAWTKKSYSSAADFLFQVAFAATAATIVSGAVAGRMKFGSYLVYSAVLTGLIYPISGMWKWGGGFLDAWGFQDFAGSVIVHAVGGFAGLAGAIVLGARMGRFKNGKSTPMPGHNITFAALGVFILWIGWYGFNPGSQLTYHGISDAEVTTWIALTTTVAAAAGAVVAMITAWTLFKKPDVTMALNGALAGLVGITANCNQVTEIGALIIGGVAGVLVVGGILLLDKLRIDDPVGAWPVHGLCGIWGGIATGLLGTQIPATIFGMEGTRGLYIAVQCAATLIICVWAFATMFGVFYVLKLFGVLRVSAEEERAGLDISEHGMHAYPPNQVQDFMPSPAQMPAPAGATPSLEPKDRV